MTPPLAFPAGNADPLSLTPCRIAGIARHALYRELAVTLKPGLVGPDDNGSHSDMTMSTFVRSLQSLRPHLRRIAEAGADGQPFALLQRLGIAAEADMLAATGGINTHRGAIFNLGLLAAATASLAHCNLPLSARHIAAHVRDVWGAGILQSARNATAGSHGATVHQRHGAHGARGEAAAGFRTVIGCGLPAYRRALGVGCPPDAAALHALFALIAVTADTNLLWRGGPRGLAFAQRVARRFLSEGGVMSPGWQLRAARLQAAFRERRLSPGGSADLLAATLFLHRVEVIQRGAPPLQEHRWRP